MSKKIKNSDDDLRRLRVELNRACKVCGRLFADHGAAPPHTNEACSGFVEQERRS